MVSRLLVLIIALVLLIPARGLAQAQPDLRTFNRHVEAAMQAAERADVTALQTEYNELHDAWATVEDGVRNTNITLYAEIEKALQMLQVAAVATPANIELAKTSLQTLEHSSEALSVVPGPSAAAADGALAAMRSLNLITEEALAAAGTGDLDMARTKFDAFEGGWFAAEGTVREASPDAYHAIESAMGEVRVAFAGQPVDPQKLTDALNGLEHANEAYITGAPIATTASDAAPPELRGLLAKLTEAVDALGRGDVATAVRELDEFRTGWPDVEGVVAAKDAGVYRSTEVLMARAAADLSATPVNIASVSTTITQLRDDLEPYAVDDLQYGVFDATAILLREGLEAILIVAALLAFLQKAGNSDKRAWIWGGGLLGIIVSVLGGIAIQRFFSTVITGTNRELIEGLTALVAAAMLFYVSFWLHRKTQLQGWQRYIQEKTTAALATGSLFSLGLLSFLAVLREGAETTLFYIGIAPSISQRDLLLGLAIGIVVLVVAGAGVLMLGRRLPLKPFFTVTSLLIFYLGFKFVGAGIHSLQVARVLPASPSVYLPSIDLIGMYPTWETTLLQVAMVVLASVVVRVLSRPSAA